MAEHSRSTTGIPGGVDAAEERILLLVQGDRDRELIADRLADRHDVHRGMPDGTWESFDLCIVDAATYRRVKTDLTERKATVEAFLPVLLLVPDRETAGAPRWLEEELAGTVDDVLVVPSPKHRLDARVEALLRTRRQSKTLALFRRAMDEATQGIIITNADGPDNPITYVNDGFCRITGYDPEDVTGRNCRFLQGPETDPETVAELRRAVTRAEPVTVELLNYRVDGEPFWNEVSITPIQGEDGHVSHFIGFQRDVTERVERQRALRRERERFEALANSANDAIMVVDADGRLVYANPAVERVFGYAPEELQDRPITILMPERYRADHTAGFARYLESGKRTIDWQMTRFTGLHADGHEFPIEISFADFEGPTGQLFAGIVRDVTERVEREQELERYETVFQTMSDAAWVIDADGTVALVNDVVLESIGLDRSTLEGIPYDEFGDPFTDRESFERYCEAVEAVLRGDRETADLDTTLNIQGETVVLNVRVAPIAPDGPIGGVVVIARDVTERVERERELERYAAVVETVVDPIYVVDDEGYIVQVNEATVEATGFERAELIGSHVSLITRESDVERAEAYIREFIAGERNHASLEGPLLRRNEHPRTHVHNLTMLEDDGEFRGTVISAHDVHDLREHQRRLSVLDRVLRHNLRNRMNLVLGFADELAEHGDGEVERLATGIRDSARELLELSESARRFNNTVATDDGETARLDVTDLAEHAVSTARDAYPEADVTLDAPGSAEVIAPETFELALQEVLENAIAHNDRATPTVEITVGSDADGVLIRVTDDGPGIDDVDRRALQRGTETPLEHSQGLGLWLVSWSVENADGDVEIAENEPRGTVVTIRLPNAPAVGHT